MLRKFLLVYSIVFIVVGVLGLATHGLGQHSSNLLGVFPINGLHNLAHLLIGGVGLLCYARGAGPSRTFLRVVGAAYLLLGLIGIVSPSGFGLMPIGGADVVLHVLAGLAALYVGFSSRWRLVPQYGGT